MPASSAEFPGSIPSQGPRHIKDVKMVPVVPLFSTNAKRETLAISQTFLDIIPSLGPYVRLTFVQ